jgi:AcrR family transcriptional regulator
MKKQPEQQRATATFERILEVAAQTLADVGIDRLSTNLVCQRAGLSPPALYRYFPNKYALLNELGRRLMQHQNELIPHWITREVLAGSAQGLQVALEGLLLDTFRATRATIAGVWITRALRAVPALAEVRLESHAQVTGAQAALLREVYPQASADELRLVSRVTVELLYAAVEMLFDEPPLDTRAVAQIVSTMVASYLGRLQGAAATGEPAAAAAPARRARKSSR